jgi:ADP-heptose:LPS heptosyltransferase
MQPLPLVIYHKQLGDLLLLEPALAKLSAASNQPVRLSTRRGFLPIVSLMENVIGESGIRISRASEVISFSGNFHAAAKTFTTFAPSKKLRVKNPSHLKPWQAIVYPQGAECATAESLYRAKYYFEVMPCVGTIPFRPPKLQSPPDSWRHPELPPNYILLHPTSAWPSKSWPAHNWAKVLDALEKRGIGPFVITGGNAPWEQEFANTICHNTVSTTLNLSGQTSLEQYLHAVSHARMVLCIDGSSSHLAPAFSRPSITLFGETSHIVWHFETAHSHAIFPPRKTIVTINPISGITVAEVIQRALGCFEAPF